jgi:sec-independent protein translocase protein TatC
MDAYSRSIIFITETRKYLLSIVLLLLLGTFGFYLISPYLYTFLQDHLHQKLVFYTVAEPFLAHVQLALSVNIFVLVPILAIFFWRSMAKPFHLSTKSQVYFVIFTCFLFYCGSLFCFFITLPYGIDFLLGFESEQLQATISIGKFVTFVTVFVLAFGLIFELPIFMVFSVKTGLLKRENFENGRRYAVLVISIVAALLTPTPDIVNMLLMGGPLYLLYEFGIIVLKLMRLA